LVVRCSYGHGKHSDASSVVDAGRVADADGLTDPARHSRTGAIPANGERKMNTATANEPVSGYDKLKTKEVITSLTSHSQVELAEIEDYERAHQDRPMVFDKLRWLRQEEPIPGYDASSPDEIATKLENANPSVLKRVRGYERKFGARREVLEEVDRLHRERRVPLVSRDSNV
jgi:hypothetical protein